MHFPRYAWWGLPTVEVDGQALSIEVKPVLVTGIAPGDRYVAERPSGRELLTCNKISRGGWLVAEESSSRYLLHECYKVLREA